MKKEIKEYFAKLGAKGGKKSKRTITPEQQKMMQKSRKEKSTRIEAEKYN